MLRLVFPVLSVVRLDHIPLLRAEMELDVVAQIVQLLQSGLGAALLSPLYPQDKKIEMLYTAISIYKLVYGQNLMDKHASISRYYYLISTYLLAQGKTEETFECLEKMVYHSKKYDKSYESDRGKYYSSALTDKIKYIDDRKYVHNCSYYMLDDLDSNRFDSIRENEKFKALYTMCKESAK